MPPPFAAPPPRPSWARKADHWTERLAGAVRLLWPRPSEAALTTLAAEDRPGGAVPIPEDVRRAARDSLCDPLALGRAAWSSGAFGDALHHFGEAISRDPKNAWAWHGRGDALQLLGAYADAEAAYAEAARLAPREALHHSGRANALSAQGDAAGAAAARQQAAQRTVRR